jgi:Domain of unknown function (DUF1835)
VILHVINGDAAAADLAAAFGKVEMLVWRDVLHEGPVPAVIPERLAEIRAEFLAERGWADRDEARIWLGQRDARLAAVEPSDKVVLWFEDDLYDQLQLIQVLDRLTEHNGPIDLMALPREGRTPLLVRHAHARALGEPELVLARRAWAAFTAPDPHALQDLWLAGTPELPDLGPALGRLLEELPATSDGLSRTGRQLLARMPATLVELVGSNRVDEPRPFASEWVIESRLRGLSDLARGDWTGYELTEAGIEVAAGRRRHEQIDRWLGGVRLTGPRARFEWDPVARRVH